MAKNATLRAVRRLLSAPAQGRLSPRKKRLLGMTRGRSATTFAERRVATSHLLSYSVVRMMWWFLILGISTLVVVCVAIALYMRLRRHLLATQAAPAGNPGEVEHEPQSSNLE